MKIIKSILLTAIIIGISGLTTNIHKPELRGEEPLRISVSYEMEFFKSYFAPTFLGEPYTHKPPFYN